MPAAMSLRFAPFQLATGTGPWLPAGLATQPVCTRVQCYSASHPSEQMIWISHVLFSFHLIKLMVSQKLKVLLFHDADLHT